MDTECLADAVGRGAPLWMAVAGAPFSSSTEHTENTQRDTECLADAVGRGAPF